MVTDPATKATLPQTWKGASAGLKGATRTVDAPVVVALVVPEANEMTEQLANRFDLGQLAMQLMVAAAGFGVASGHASCKDQELARSAIGFPEDRECALLVALGYPGDGPLRPIRKPSRRPFDDVVHLGSWQLGTLRVWALSGSCEFAARTRHVWGGSLAGATP